MLRLFLLQLFLLSIVGKSVQKVYQINMPSKCLDCICKAIGGNCEMNNEYCTNDDDRCGPFAITYSYWVDSGAPLLDSSKQYRGSQDAFQRCTEDISCSKRSVRGYITNFPRDCDFDGNIDCFDFIRLHLFGPNNCQQNEFPNRKIFDECWIEYNTANPFFL